jgi:selenocysteine lyase/cysteine desulfurase
MHNSFNAFFANWKKIMNITGLGLLYCRDKFLLSWE